MFQLIGCTAQALHSIHAASVVHRDLEPSNILLGSNGPWVIDVGIARATDTTQLTRSGGFIGTPQYMSPEHALGRTVGAATDVFALGLIAAVAATGRHPYGDGAGLSIAAAIANTPQQAPDLSGYPEPLRRLLGPVGGPHPPLYGAPTYAPAYGAPTGPTGPTPGPAARLGRVPLVVGVGVLVLALAAGGTPSASGSSSGASGARTYTAVFKDKPVKFPASREFGKFNDVDLDFPKVASFDDIGSSDRELTMGYDGIGTSTSFGKSKGTTHEQCETGAATDPVPNKLREADLTGADSTIVQGEMLCTVTSKRRLSRPVDARSPPGSGPADRPGRRGSDRTGGRDPRVDRSGG
ncbi:protein kinase [Streptomyces sp. NPDC092307]|uniref:protein kinase domain-containing protein n=1 Tax=Streptomyces sp. NPDC092307 TaxID=3366013 RepID=UPI0038044BC3